MRSWWKVMIRRRRNHPSSTTTTKEETSPIPKDLGPIPSSLSPYYRHEFRSSFSLDYSVDTVRSLFIPAHSSRLETWYDPSLFSYSTMICWSPSYLCCARCSPKMSFGWTSMAMEIQETWISSPRNPYQIEYLAHSSSSSSLAVEMKALYRLQKKENRSTLIDVSIQYNVTTSSPLLLSILPMIVTQLPKITMFTVQKNLRYRHDSMVISSNA